jgi:hypothetical protein
MADWSVGIVMVVDNAPVALAKMIQMLIAPMRRVAHAVLLLLLLF